MPIGQLDLPNWGQFFWLKSGTLKIDNSGKNIMYFKSDKKMTQKRGGYAGGHSNPQKFFFKTVENFETMIAIFLVSRADSTNPIEKNGIFWGVPIQFLMGL